MMGCTGRRPDVRPKMVAGPADAEGAASVAGNRVVQRLPQGIAKRSDVGSSGMLDIVR